VRASVQNHQESRSFVTNRSADFLCNPPAPAPRAPNSTAAQDVASHRVPPKVEVLNNGPCPSTGEGRAIATLTDAVPGAQPRAATGDWISVTNPSGRQSLATISQA